MHSHLVLRSNGVALLLIADDQSLPRVLHWGADLGEITADQFTTLLSCDQMPVTPNAPDQSLVVGLIPELRLGWTGKPGLIGSRDGRQWSLPWKVTGVWLNGEPTEGFVMTGAASVRYLAQSEGLDLSITVELLNSGLVRARAELTNAIGPDYRVDELTLAMPVPSPARELLDFAGRWGNERTPQRRDLVVGQHRREGRHGRTGADSAYILHLGEAGFGYRSGKVWAVHTAWSGNHIHYAERDYQGVQLIGGGELLLPDEGVLTEGETYQTPWIFFNYADGLDAQAARFHSYLRGLPVSPDPERPVSINVWEAVYFNHDPARLIDLAERAADLGVERYVLDDGWFGARRDDHAGLGDWVVSPEVWPEGLHPLVNRVKELGMQFGLWFEPEMINADSDTARAHPEWIMQPGGRWPIESRYQQVLNLTIPEAFDHVVQQMSAIFDEYAIDYVKWDHNRDLIDAGTAPGGEPAVHAQTQAYYRLLDQLRLQYPHIEFESCSSGGGRIDLEVMQRVKRVWVSDNIDPEDRQRMLWWTGQLLPTELMGSHIASGRNHTTGRWHDLNYRAATAVFGHLGIEWDLAQASETELASLSKWISWYKQNRRLIHTGQLVRVDLADPGIYLKGVVSPDQAIFSVSMLATPPCASLGHLTFPGLDPDACYRVEVINHQLLPETHLAPWQRGGEVVLTGRSLATVGLRAPQLRPSTAILFTFNRV